jgi:hypothetical protein
VSLLFSSLLQQSCLSSLSFILFRYHDFVLIFFWLFDAFLFQIAVAQFPPPVEGVAFLKSRFHENVSISYKEESPSGSS